MPLKLNVRPLTKTILFLLDIQHLMTYYTFVHEPDMYITCIHTVCCVAVVLVLKDSYCCQKETAVESGGLVGQGLLTFPRRKQQQQLKGSV